MAEVLQSNITHSYAGQELISELFYQPQEDVPSLADLYRFIPVNGDKVNVYLPQKLSKIYKKYTTCTFSAAGGTANINDKTLSVEKIKANLEECVDTWDDTIFAELMKPGVDRDNLEGTIIDRIIKRQVMKATQSDMHRLIWFADDADADTDWDHFNGFIRLFLDNSSSIGASCFIDADSTAFESSDALASDGAIGLLRQIWENQNAVLRTMPNRKFYVTHTVADNLRTTLENAGTDSGLARIENGDQGLRFRGVPIVEVPEWDLHLADTTNPHYTGSGLSIGSNLIVYTTADNLVFGSDIRDNQNNMKIRYADDDDEKMKITSKLKLGAQVLHYDLVCLAY